MVNHLSVQSQLPGNVQLQSPRLSAPVFQNQPQDAVVINTNASLRWLSRDSPNLAEACEAIHRIIRDGNRAGFVDMAPLFFEWLMPLRRRKGSIIGPEFVDTLRAVKEAAGFTFGDDGPNRWVKDVLRHCYGSYWLATKTECTWPSSWARRWT